MNNDIILKDADALCKRAKLNWLQGATVLVTGASGLVGTYVIASLYCLRQYGINIDVYAQVLSEVPSHISDFVAHKSGHVLRLNLADFADYGRLPEADVIIHAAGYAQPAKFMSDPVTTLQINTTATMSLLKHLRPNGHFIFTSSSEVYSGLEGSNFAETSIGRTDPYHPRSAYIEGKRCGEAICYAFRSQGVHATSVRLGDVYGPGTKLHDRRVLNTFIEKAIRQNHIDLLDSGTAIRTYCYVADAVELMWRILYSGKEPVYNVGGRTPFTISELAYKIAEIMSVSVSFPEVQSRVPGAPKVLGQNLVRLDREFPKESYVDLDAGLRATIEWQRDLYRQPLVRTDG